MANVTKTVKRKGTLKSRILEHEHIAAKEFLKNDPVGKRIQAAEHIITLILKDELPRVKRFLFNSSYSFREYDDPSKFEQAIRSGNKQTELKALSKSKGYLKTNLEKDNLQFILYYKKGINMNDAFLFSETLKNVCINTFAAVGIDMSGVFAREELLELKKGTAKSDKKRASQ